MVSDYELVIGLEVHAQLQTRTKLFCGDAVAFGAPPNTLVSAISLGHPGTLPRLNREAIPLAIRLGLATDCTIVRDNYFARKNYFYPDLPKGYQISQHTTPICRDGKLEIQVGKQSRTVRINRIHIEEDAGKSAHDLHPEFSAIDYNRAGTPLLEIVTEPDLHSAEEAAAYVTALRKLVRHLGVCDGNMEEGSLRCDVNISVRPRGDARLGTRVELKNLNSIRFIRKAVEAESARLIDLHRRGETIRQETRGFNEAEGTTYSIRAKEDEEDYRYFPDPDLPPFHISEAAIEAVRASMPALPAEVTKELMASGLSEYDARLIADDPELTRLFHELKKLEVKPKPAANWIIGPVKNGLAAAEQSLDETALRSEALARLITLVEEGVLSFGLASGEVLPELFRCSNADPDALVEAKGLRTQGSGEELDALVEAALERHGDKIAEYRKGKKGLLSLFVGEVMKRSKGRADARLVTEKIQQRLTQS